MYPVILTSQLYLGNIHLWLRVLVAIHQRKRRMMRDAPDIQCTAFVGECRVASGGRAEVAVVIRGAISEAQEPVLVFDDATGRVVELDLRGTVEEVARRYATDGRLHAERLAAPQARGPGRPKLGVVGREVTLLPRHWAWLGAQRGGASATLRRLVEAARREAATEDGVRHAQDAAYRFMAALAGDRPGYEEAVRALYAGDMPRFLTESEPWPQDVRAYARQLAAPAFERLEDAIDE